VISSGVGPCFDWLAQSGLVVQALATYSSKAVTVRLTLFGAISPIATAFVSMKQSAQ